MIVFQPAGTSLGGNGESFPEYQLGQVVAEWWRKILTEQVTSTLQQTLPTLLKEALKQKSVLSNPSEETRATRKRSKNLQTAVWLDFISKPKRRLIWRSIHISHNCVHQATHERGFVRSDANISPHKRDGRSSYCSNNGDWYKWEYIKQKFGYRKTKEVFLSDDGLVERQRPILAVARSIAAALDRLDAPPNPEEGEEASDPDPGEIKSYLEDALVL